ncbi:uncharacterized protein L3040_005529 [Drepanopeziza brunnea f. sp. 'multigermtubi']|uniref:Protein prenyltransferase n=1 Tax=Marssonina brunnea f. sp. multigermtubi (strain MB_m1) TaxID=1072389 RepID=K1WNC6_MARBU|nr:uncharacterized protein MBM_08053 [Drepanopeziza brunnea f. sp. 'multigermtubi' MB_m1]EKD13852.1 hypothetical protein MBM_08053 [Drepanopeziza brunnea f. sp. 'multigermtubi' MB_m1]KAJ5040970.1 hypothetical protein L3040_005529 [Drepanopeziza brunnea f. sp. 'multigermtubi']
MSRALDPGTASSLDTTDNLIPVYHDIAAALRNTSSDLLEIELLGTSHPLPPGRNVLIAGKSIGTTKVKLVQAFMVARRIFFRYVRNCPEDKEVDLLDATAVMLLLDPEQLTAANERKRLIKKREIVPKLEFEALLKKEIQFVDSYLTSRLHRHTKSPTLWGHRRWLLEMGKKIGVQYDIQPDLTSVVLVAAERHSRNYYAWSHLRWLIQTFSDTPTCVRDFSTPTIDSDYPGTMSAVKNWCLKNPSDTSGFSFLLFCLFGVADEDSNTSVRSEMCSSVCTDVLRLAVSFRWTHESVWLFLRTAVASKYATEELREAFTRAMEDISTAQTQGQPILEAARDWCARNQQIIGNA